MPGNNASVYVSTLVSVSQWVCMGVHGLCKRVHMCEYMHRCALSSWSDERAALRSVITCSRLRLWTRAPPRPLEGGSFITRHAAPQPTDRQTDRQWDRQTVRQAGAMRKTCHACSELISLFVDPTCTCCPRAAGLHWRSVLKVTHIYPLNMRWTDRRIRPDTV